MAPDEPNVSIGRADNSAFAFGAHARAETHNTAAPARDESAEQLLAAVRELRADLARLRENEQAARLDTTLADTEEEITRTGTAGEGRMQRLREALTDAQSILTLFASAGTVAGLLGM
ncbi:hypothetical protein ACPCIX_10825 [Streptomyces pseudogriseolus]|uniref:Uncharacterized protein n=2 Tax=Streptomyces TaxID=1883 RepID=M3DCU5_STREZ|nr:MULTISPECIES: hypothetical protein [Streptomyces]EMF27640.1 hypothetical protein H114_18356 [Streptomyces gancidicus BKS 13-15]MCI4141759.1 hypothetical protein [Streptomyces sp. MMS20-AI2-20]